MWANDPKKWQNDGESITNPPGFGVIGYQSPRPAQSHGPTPHQSTRGQTNPPQSLQTPANRPQQTGQPAHISRGIGQTETTETTDNPGPINRGQSIRPNPAQTIAQSLGANRPENGPKDQPGPTPSKTQTTPQTGQILK